MGLVDGRTASVDPGVPVNARIATVAGHQRGRVSRHQLRSAGVRESAIDRRLRNGHLVRVLPGVYAVGHLAEADLAEETAALLFYGSRAALSHHSAATLLGLRIGCARPVHVTVPEACHGPRHPTLRLHRSRTLLRRDVTRHRGLPVTTAARTLLDIAATELTLFELEQALAEAMIHHRVSERAVRDVLRRAGGHHGRARLGHLLDGPQEPRSQRVESPAEALVVPLLREAGLPRFVTQHQIGPHRVDIYFPELQLAVEVDGNRIHGVRRAITRDRRKDADLQTRGVTAIRVTAAEARYEPKVALARVAMAAGAALTRG